MYKTDFLGPCIIKEQWAPLSLSHTKAFHHSHLEVNVWELFPGKVLLFSMVWKTILRTILRVYIFRLRPHGYEKASFMAGLDISQLWTGTARALEIMEERGRKNIIKKWLHIWHTSQQGTDAAVVRENSQLMQTLLSFSLFNPDLHYTYFSHYLMDETCTEVNIF